MHLLLKPNPVQNLFEGLMPEVVVSPGMESEELMWRAEYALVLM
jgi:hypothetical protein